MAALLLLQLCFMIAMLSAHGNKFKSCSQSGFCQRQKAANGNDYVIDTNSIRLHNDAFECVMLHQQNPNDNNKKIKLSISRVIDNVIRIFVTELDGIRARYQINDILTENARKFLKFSNVQQTENGCTMSWNDKYSVSVQYQPFRVKVLNEGNLEVLINEFDHFYFEPYATRKDYSGCEGDECPTEPQHEKDLWEERFSSHTYHYDHGAASIGLDFSFVDSRFVYGIPEHASQLALKNTNECDSGSDSDCYAQPYRLWNLDVFEYKLDVPDALYGAIPYVLACTAKYCNSVLWMNSAETYVDVSDRAGPPSGKNVRWMSESGVLEAFIMLNDARADSESASYLRQYYELTGYPQLPPMFSLGHHQCRWNYNDVQDVHEISDKFEQLNIPTDFIWLDIEHTDGKRYFTWDEHNFGDAQTMINYVASSGRKMVTIVDPHIKKDENYYIYKEINDLDLWVKDRHNNAYDGWCWPGDSRYPDFTNPKMRQFWSEQFKFDKYQHSTPDLFTWNDMNEPSVFNGPEVSMPISNIHFNQVRHNEVHNIYGYYVHEATFNGLLLRSDFKHRPFVLSRAFFAGSQKYGAIWTGDNTANWEHLAISVPMLLSLSVSGLPFVGADIGGFFNNPDGELMSRWYELGAYYPFFRNHAHQDTQRRELWKFGEEYAQRMKNAILARYRILPYVYTLFYLSSSPQYAQLIMRPLWYGEFSSDAATYHRDDAFMFGGAFYIQPITQPGVEEVDVDLPQNMEHNALFYEMYENRVNIYEAGKHHLIGYKARIPVLRYGGTITTEKHRIRRSAALMKYDPITIVIALDAHNNAKGYHYMDDEYSLQAQHILTSLHYDGTQNKLYNRIISGNQSESADIAQIEIERIVILGKNVHENEFKEIHIEQGSNSRKTKHFGVGKQNILAIRKPMLLINEEFVLTMQ